MYTQILSKNGLVINAEEEKGKKKGEKENKENKKRMDMVNTEKRKEKQEVQLLSYQQIPLPCQKSTKTTESKVKSER